MGTARRPSNEYVCMADAPFDANRSRSRDLKQVRVECEARLRTLAIPEPFELAELRDILQRRRGRPIHLLPLSSDLGPFGLWVAATRADYVFFARSTTPLHQVHIIVHELAHLFLDHAARPISDHELLRIALPDLQPSMVQTVLERGAYTAREELEAEILASIILERVAHAGAASPHSILSEEAVAVLARLTEALQLD